MLINIILIVVFVIILLLNYNIIEGQEPTNNKKYTIFTIFPDIFNELFKSPDNDDDNINVGGIEVFEKKKTNTAVRTEFSDIFTGYGIYSDNKDDVTIYDENNISSCKDINSNEDILDQDILDNYHSILKTDENQLNNVDNVDMSGNFNINILDFNLNFISSLDDSSAPNINELNNDSIKLCNLVELLYDNNIDNSIKEKLSASYGECYFKNENEDLNKFNKYCVKSCYDNIPKIPDCNEYEYNDSSANVCPIYNEQNIMKYGAGNLFSTHINKGGLFYNCGVSEKVSDMVDVDHDELHGKYNQKPLIQNICSPKYSACKSDELKEKKCEDLPVNECENYYYNDSENNNNKYNCFLLDNACKSETNNLKKRCFTIDTIINYDKCHEENSIYSDIINKEEHEIEYSVNLF